jgi:HPt (histidine-containing phosphotransfer) domain-containing protein
MERITDLTFLQGFTGGNPDKMKKYISMFLQLCPNSLATMKSHLENGDYDGLRGVAHQLKPQVTYMGIKPGEPLVKAIEHQAGTRTNVEQLPAMLTEFDGICRKAMEELSKEIA